jgi:hypothetical protein
MNDDEVLARFGISSRLAHGLMVQSVLVIIAALISIWGIFEAFNGSALNYITNIISLLVCISLLVYSFIGFNSERNQEAFFISSIVLYIILIIFGLFTTTISFKNPVSMLTLITLVSTIFFLREYTRNYKVANFAMLIVIISGLIVLAFNMMNGMPWFIALKYIIIPVTIALTYFERSQRGKYDFAI